MGSGIVGSGGSGSLRAWGVLVAVGLAGCPRGGTPVREGGEPGTVSTVADGSGSAADVGWQTMVVGEGVGVEVERRLFERPGDDHFLIRVRVRNQGDRVLGMDLRDYWTVVYPNQWGAQSGSRREVIDEGRMPAKVLDEGRCADLRRAFGAGELALLPVGGAVEYYREFNASGRAEVEVQAVEPYLFVSLAGQVLVTDGDRCGSVTLDWAPEGERESWETDLVLAAPIGWGVVPADGLVVGSERRHEVPALGVSGEVLVPERVGLRMELPSPADARWLNVSVLSDADGRRIVGCESNLEGGCDRTRTCPLDEAEGGAYVAKVGAVWSMPRCEPPSFGPNHFRVELELGDEHRRTWIPPEWFRLAGGEGPPAEGDPCLAEMRLAWWIYEAFDRCDRAARRSPGRCHESCCPPELRGPGPDGTVECCFCEGE